MTAAGVIMAVVVHYMVEDVVPLISGEHGFLTLAPKFILIVVVATAVYLIPCYLMRLAEAKFFVSRIRDMMIKSFNLT